MATESIHTVFAGSLLRAYVLATDPDHAVQLAEEQDGPRRWWERLLFGRYTAKPGMWF